MNQPNNRPFFILACDRSGTTLLRLMLNAHPRLCVPNESDFITELYDRVSEFGAVERVDNLDGLLDALFANPRYRLWKLDDQCVRQAAQRSDQSLRGIIESVFVCFAERDSKPRWGDKTPRYTVRVETLARLFPDAQIILLARDPRAVHASLKTVNWHPHCPLFNANKWREYWIKATRDLSKYYPLNHLVVKYEDLVAEPEAVLRRICEFLKEDYAESMLHYYQTARQHQPEDLEHHELTLLPVSTVPARKWMDTLNSYEIFVVEHITGDLMESLGYKPSPAPNCLASAWFTTRLAFARCRQRAASLRNRSAST